MSELKRTPLYDEHKKLNGRIVPFAGWEMPVQYSGVIDEHMAVRKNVGLFDVSHMGEFEITGDKALDYLNRVTTNNVAKLEDGGCQYTLLCYENGTVVDDLILSRVAKNHYIAIVNAANLEKDFAWLEKQNSEGATLKNVSDDYALIAVQGPKSPALVAKVFNQDFTSLKYYNCTEASIGDANVKVFRTGYTGEDGFELMVEAKHACTLWQQLLVVGADYGVKPCGLGARDTLRLEVAYSLYGHEINSEINALEANLGWVVKLQKGDFIGREALQSIKDQGVTRKIVGFEMAEAGIGRDGCPVFVGDKQIGYVTSGTHAPLLKKAVGIALIDVNYKDVGTEILIDIRGKKKKAVVQKTPFYNRCA
ncbi:MAG: glycine cleavage system aminomethyltransferase GcvT [bacterium]|nr:glycine cleavage system aminomethyltransferase GcvT [bacterium]MBU1918279.1 glycine cleavage system aminomethyltransferase GcvT [bacterium]